MIYYIEQPFDLAQGYFYDPIHPTSELVGILAHKNNYPQGVNLLLVAYLVYGLLKPNYTKYQPYPCSSTATRSSTASSLCSSAAPTLSASAAAASTQAARTAHRTASSTQSCCSAAPATALKAFCAPTLSAAYHCAASTTTPSSARAYYGF